MAEDIKEPKKVMTEDGERENERGWSLHKQPKEMSCTEMAENARLFASSQNLL